MRDWIRATVGGILIVSFASYPLILTATVKRWNGGTSLAWSDDSNWTPAGVPSESDDIILDNTFLGSDYLLVLPDSSTSVNSLTISPSSGRKIEFDIPVRNKSVPALRLASSNNSLVLGAGALFKNSSGLSSGQSITMNGKFVIRNGGIYLHNTRASHATGLVAKLSTEAGTDAGEFVFDVPGGAYSLSLSNRNYGTLRLLSAASEGTQTYNATGSSVSNIRGDLQIARGVTCNLDLEKTLTVEGDFSLDGGILNLATQPNNLQLILKGEVMQSTDGVITESSSGQPLIVFSGDAQQQVFLKGSCLNSVGYVMSNPWGVFLEADLLISYSLQLKTGKIKSSAAAMLQIGDDARVSGASEQSFVDGPVRKTGDEDFEFPVGKQGDFAALKLSGVMSNSTDQCVVEYHHGNPQELFGSGMVSPGIIRVSSLEYWSIEKIGAFRPGKVTLSVGAYSHATSLEKLVVTSWNASAKAWANCGNSAYSGISSGIISSNAIEASGIFTVGTTVPDQNPLPVFFESLTGIWTLDKINLAWRAHNQKGTDSFLIEFSEDGLEFQQDTIIQANLMQSDYAYEKEMPFRRPLHFRVTLLDGGEKKVQSQEIFVRPSLSGLRVSLYPVPAINVLHARIVSAKAFATVLVILDIAGRRRYIGKVNLTQGGNEIEIPLWDLQGGLYFLQLQRESSGAEVYPFLVRKR